jgi:hypothetical protein
MYQYGYVCMHLLYMYMCVWLCISVHVCMYICVYTWCMYVSCIYACLCTQNCNIHMCTQAYFNVCVCACAWSVYVRLCVCVHTHTCVCVCVCVYSSLLTSLTKLILSPPPTDHFHWEHACIVEYRGEMFFCVDVCVWFKHRLQLVAALYTVYSI